MSRDPTREGGSAQRESEESVFEPTLADTFNPPVLLLSPGTPVEPLGADVLESVERTEVRVFGIGARAVSSIRTSLFMPSLVLTTKRLGPTIVGEREGPMNGAAPARPVTDLVAPLLSTRRSASLFWSATSRSRQPASHSGASAGARCR